MNTQANAQILIESIQDNTLDQGINKPPSMDFFALGNATYKFISKFW